ncbi:MAG: nucleoside-diphosphate kinase [Chitinivibrionales bacterium]|nr:nucleoside-diphosphate kinase [Chitinivibrionales bacterium]
MPISEQRTLAIIKPDAVSKKLSGKIIDMIESHGLTIIGMKMVRFSKEQASRFYAVHTGKYFFNNLVAFISSGNSIVLALQAPQAISQWRELMGSTDPATAAEGTIRKLYGTTVSVNACHGSDCTDSAAFELAFFFEPDELFSS